MQLFDHLNLTALFLLGLLGSGHCVGMCGPLVLAFPARQGGRGAHLAYNFGRVTTYTLLGALLGAFGAGLSWMVGSAASLVWMARVQVGFAVVAGVALALFGLVKLGLMREPRFLTLANPTHIPGFKTTQKRLVARRAGVGGVFLIGLMLGLLPCGLSFAAFARALAAGGPLEGALMALAFGLGTMPALFVVGAGASRLSRRHRRLSDGIAGALMIAMAVSLGLDVLSSLA
ncbi:MAG: sulfite exporter TauE/SafE family protein [Myxococcota bacterium]